MRKTSRFAAFAVHLGISFMLFLILAAVIRFFWYPGILFSTEGGWQGLRLIAGIDFIVGPVLTLVVYKSGKKSLNFDLTCIGIMQLVCVAYGMNLVHQSRPAVVGYAGVFFTVNVQTLEAYSEEAIAKSTLLKQDYPIWVNVKLPEETKARTVAKMQFFAGGFGNALDKLEPFENALPYLSHEGKSLAGAQKDGLIIPDDLADKNARVFLFATRYGEYPIAVNITDGIIIGLLDHTEASATHK